MSFNPYMPLPLDKANHYAVGSWIYMGVYAPLRFFGVFDAKHYALAAVVIAALGKEALDKYLNVRAIKRGETPSHGVEFNDWLATVASAGLMWSVSQ